MYSLRSDFIVATVGLGFLLLAILCVAPVVAESVLLEDQKLMAWDAASGDQFGTAVSIDGNTMAIGSPEDDDNGIGSGSAYLFSWDGNSWSLIQKLVASDGAEVDMFGYSLDLDGETLVVGARLDDDRGNGSGSAYVFSRTSTGWYQQAKLLASDGQDGDQFGHSVAVSGNRIVVGARLNDETAFGAGAAYVFEWNGSTWVEDSKLLAEDGRERDWFGEAVAIDGDSIVVGTNVLSSPHFLDGSAYVFAVDGGDWVQTAKLTDSDDDGRLGFGTSVSIDGDLVIVGAGRVQSTEPVYVFSKSDDQWTEQYRIRVDGTRGFGVKVEVQGHYALIGETGGDGAEDNSGLAHLFRRLGSRWVRVAVLAASDGSDQDAFGTALSLNGEQALVGALSTDEVGSQSGSSYYFGLPMAIEVDVRPWSDENKVNLRSRGLLPVAILTTSLSDGELVEFDAWDLDPASLALGPGGAHIVHKATHKVDVDGDGDIDMLAHFRIQEIDLSCGDDSVTLVGETSLGTTVEGLDSVQIVRCQPPPQRRQRR